jgi:hypothetical protein
MLPPYTPKKSPKKSDVNKQNFKTNLHAIQEAKYQIPDMQHEVVRHRKQD